MKRFLAPILFVFLLWSGLFLLPKNAYAICQVSTKLVQGGFIEGSTFDNVSDNRIFKPDFNGQVTLYAEADCFSPIRYNDKGEEIKDTGVKYNLVAHRSNINPKSDPPISDPQTGAIISLGTSNYLLKPGIKTGGKRSITFDFNLTNFDVGKKYPGDWVLKICQNDVVCKENILINTPITVSPTSPTPVPTDLPKAWPLSNLCAWQTGSEIELILDLKPDTEYWWWWHGDSLKAQKIRIGGNNWPFKIMPEETQKPGIRTFCIDRTKSTAGIETTSGRRCKPGDPNSITFKFQASPPEGNLSCRNTEGQTNFIIGGPLPLPCEKGVGKDGVEIDTTKTPNKSDEIVKCTKVTTAVGTIDTDPAGFIKDIFSILLGVSGGIALILIIISGYRLMASQGNPEKVQEAREMLTSAIVGLLFIIFSFVILQVIGVEILKIPGFGK